MKRQIEAALNCVCALLGFIVVCLVIARVDSRDISGISAKVRNFRQQRKKIDILFVGSSRVFHGIAPKIFDRTLREHGYDWHSFNAGMDGMNPAEEQALVRQLLACHPPRLKYIFFEFQSDPAAGTPIHDNEVQERDVYWRDLPALVAGLRKFAIGFSSSLPSTFGSRFSLGRLRYFAPLLSADTRLWFRNFSHGGRGVDLLATLSSKKPSAMHDPAAADYGYLRGYKDGFFPMDTPLSGEILTKYREAFAEMEKNRQAKLAEPVMQDQLRRFAKAMTARRIRVAFILPPAVIGNPGDEINAPPGTLLLAYDNVARYPELYAEENRLDRQHLNGRGAELFSRQLALDFLRALDSDRR